MTGRRTRPRWQRRRDLLRLVLIVRLEQLARIETPKRQGGLAASRRGTVPEMATGRAFKLLVGLVLLILVLAWIKAHGP
jgi:F0F1-type ATP synthase assembly protein I